MKTVPRAVSYGKEEFLSSVVTLILRNVLYDSRTFENYFAFAGFVKGLGLSYLPLLHLPVVFKPLPKNVFISLSSYGVFHVNTAFSGLLPCDPTSLIDFLYSVYASYLRFFRQDQKPYPPIEVWHIDVYLREIEYRRRRIEAANKTVYNILFSRLHKIPDALSSRVVGLDYGSVIDGIPRSWEEMPDKSRTILHLLHENNISMRHSVDKESYLENQQVAFSLMQNIVVDIIRNCDLFTYHYIGLLGVTRWWRDVYDYFKLLEGVLTTHYSSKIWVGYCNANLEDKASRCSNTDNSPDLYVSIVMPHCSTDEFLKVARMWNRNEQQGLAFLKEHCNMLIVLAEEQYLSDWVVNIAQACKRSFVYVLDLLPECNSTHIPQIVKKYQFANGAYVNEPEVAPVLAISGIHC